MNTAIFKAGPGNPIKDGTRFHINGEAGPTLFVTLSSPSPEEIFAIRKGDAHFGLTVLGQVLFILAKFGDLEWMDAPFSIQMLPPHERTLPAEFRAGLRYALIVVIVDTVTGEQCGARCVTVSPLFSAQLHAAVQRQIREPLSRAEYHRIINEAYREFPTSRDMLKRALVTSRGGANDDDAPIEVIEKCMAAAGGPSSTDAMHETEQCRQSRSRKDLTSVVSYVRSIGMDHVTLNTGHRRVTRNGEVASHVIDRLVALIEASCKLRVLPMPAAEKTHAIEIGINGTSLMATVWCATTLAPVATIGIGLCPEQDKECWELTHACGELPNVTSASAPPVMPWIAAQLHLAGLLGDQEFMCMLGDFERCLGWAFVEYIAKGASMQR